MTPNETDFHIPFSFDTLSYKERIGRLAETVKARFRKLIRSHTLFHLFSWTFLACEGAFLATLFPLWGRSSLAAYGLGFFFLSLFSYLLLRLYLQGKKPEQFEALRDLYIQSCKGLIDYQEGIAEHHLALAGAACKLASALPEKHLTTYPPVRFFRQPLSFREGFAFQASYRDLLLMQELLLHFAIEEHIKLVRCEPTHLEVHAALANAYVMLSSLYIDPRRGDEVARVPKGYGEREQTAYKQAAKAAIEEFRILEEYAPNDPWVYTQLAYCYHDLRMIDEEIGAYERILELCPDDLDIRFRLGMRCFEKGRAAKGLKIYQELKERRYNKADSLLGFYGANL